MKILSVKKNFRPWKRSWWKRKLPMPRPNSFWPRKRRSCSLPLEKWRCCPSSWRKRSWPLKKRSPVSRAESYRSPAKRTSLSPSAMKLSLILQNKKIYLMAKRMRLRSCSKLSASRNRFSGIICLTSGSRSSRRATWPRCWTRSIRKSQGCGNPAATSASGKNKMVVTFLFFWLKCPTSVFSALGSPQPFLIHPCGSPHSKADLQRRGGGKRQQPLLLAFLLPGPQ